jgi:hypothetical protein
VTDEVQPAAMLEARAMLAELAAAGLVPEGVERVVLDVDVRQAFVMAYVQAVPDRRWLDVLTSGGRLDVRPASPEVLRMAATPLADELAAERYRQGWEAASYHARRVLRGALPPALQEQAWRALDDYGLKPAAGAADTGAEGTNGPAGPGSTPASGSGDERGAGAGPASS